MATTEVSKSHLNDVPGQVHRKLLPAVRSGLYSLIVLAAAVSAGGYGLRAYGIFNCQASGYRSTRLGYCNAKSYGDYDHGAIWFNLARRQSCPPNAQVLFIGNSRTVFGFSSKATDGLVLVSSLRAIICWGFPLRKLYV